MAKQLEQRLKALETRTVGAHRVYAVQFADSDQVEILGTDERLPLAEFEQRYPAGLIIKWIEADLWEAL